MKLQVGDLSDMLPYHMEGQMPDSPEGFASGRARVGNPWLATAPTGPLGS